jgi:SAM-dependent methyltransferase
MISTLVRRLRNRYGEWRDGALDRRYGVQTGGVITDMRLVCIRSQNAGHGNHYEPIQLRVFRRMMAALPIRPEAFTFVDFGSGKGRALLLAAQYRFKRVIGIEHARRLHEAAEQNVARFRRLSRTQTSIELHCADATEFPLPGEDLVCFLYNPFDAVLMAKLIASMRASLEAMPRQLYVVYRNPQHPEALENSGFLRCLARNSTFAIFAQRAMSSPCSSCWSAKMEV